MTLANPSYIVERFSSNHQDNNSHENQVFAKTNSGCARYDHKDTRIKVIVTDEIDRISSSGVEHHSSPSPIIVSPWKPRGCEQAGPGPVHTPQSAGSYPLPPPLLSAIFSCLLLFRRYTLAVEDDRFWRRDSYLRAYSCCAL